MIDIALKRGNRASGASVIEMAEAEYMVSAQSYIQGIDDILALPTGVIKDGVSITINDVAQVVESPLMRRGIAELNGNGETVGGIIVMRYGENAKATTAPPLLISPSIPSPISWWRNYWLSVWCALSSCFTYVHLWLR